eukprot:CAMPEP_0198212530 /NCGR_PEP_ID=MMETSP1445-20131203/26495_1 /TAXON_ID=36898 /ORGANISM="Pyramimonas sp., Strain CCMP2087" /LENGTH=248 /DNA_ID=CAMNT_0043886995 /DNA_START=78 /DNA_END=824 /DNA_ORIENTATION=+
MPCILSRPSFQVPPNRAQHVGRVPSHAFPRKVLAAGRQRKGATCLATRSQTECSTSATNNEQHKQNSRRTLLQIASATAFSTLFYPRAPAVAIPLAPLGKVGVPTGGKKLRLTVDEAKDMLANDLAVGQYFVTGNLTKELFADDCRFKDPTNDIVGLARYVKALGILFDPLDSSVELVSIQVTGPSTIEADWTLGGTLKLPWRPKIGRIQGHTIYTLNNDGIVQTQEQQWSISGVKALVETFTPGAGK